MGCATQAIIVCAPGGGDPRREIGGLTLIERLMRQLSELGTVQEILLVSPPGVSLPSPSARVTTPVRSVRASGADPWAMLRAAAALLRTRFLVIAADLVVDERVLSWLATQAADTMVRHADAPLPELLGSLSREGVLQSSGLPASTVVVPLNAFPTYWEERRGHVPLHCLRVRGELDHEDAWRCLLDHVEKRALDVPARYFDPFFEGFLIRRLCRTSVTPNQVTLATGILGFAVTGLFGTGWLRLGIVLAILVEVLDGVDGKLARIKRMTSKAGELEHVLDFFYENSWYVALGYFLSATGVAWAWKAGLAMVAFDLTDNLANLAFSHFRGRNLSEANLFLKRFQTVGGRRNIYIWIFLPGFLGGAPAVTFALAATWAGVTAIVHVVYAVIESWRIALVAPRIASGRAVGKEI